MLALACCVATGIVSGVAAAVGFAVTVKNFFPMPLCGDANSVARANNRSEIAAYEDWRGTVQAFSQVGQNAVIAVHAVHPLETFAAEIQLVQSGIFDHDFVQIGHALLDPR